MVSMLLAQPTESDGRTAPRATIRISRPPRLDPPYDDERDDAMPTEVRRYPVPVPAQPPLPITADRDSGVSDSGRAAMAYVRLCIEVLNGYRSPSHLRRIGGPVEFTDVIDQIRRRHNAIGHFQTSGRALNERVTVAAGARNPAPIAYGRPAAPPTDLRSMAAGNATDRSAVDPTRPAAFSLTRLRVSEPRDGAAEVVAVLSRAGTALAVALRLERRRGAWICVLVQVV